LISDDFRLGEINLFNGRRRRSEMNDLRSLRAHQERRLFDRVMSDRNNQISPVDRLMDPVPFGKSGNTFGRDVAARCPGSARVLDKGERPVMPRSARSPGPIRRTDLAA
jgi:hypothetical protein